MKLKVCGMKYNTQEVAALQPDYLGFIFWEPSKRYFEREIPKISDNTKKIGVFVDASIEDILDKVEKYNLWGVQLHGKESASFCAALRKKNIATQNEVSTALDQTAIEIIKVFSLNDNFDFEQLTPFETVCDFYLFDTKGKLPGGNGFTFNWEVLKNYTATKPYFLSGGIGIEETESIKEFVKKPEANYCHAIDINSRFEDKPGLKNIEKLKMFKNELITDN